MTDVVREALRTTADLPHYATPEAVVAELQPEYPVYCVRPHAIHRAARLFLDKFPGDTLYAVKCNPAPHMLRALYHAGIRHFDTASLAEIALVSQLFPDSVCYFMHPVKARSAIAEAHSRYGVRHHVVDHPSELQKLSEVITANRDVVILVRLAVHHTGAVYDLSSKFGTSVEGTLALLAKIESLGFSAGLCFHVGSQCLDPDAYRLAMESVAEVRARSPIALGCIDVGGGFPGRYLNDPVEGVSSYIDAVIAAARGLGELEESRLFCEPGRGLTEGGESLITQVQLRKGSALYLNDGIYGSMNEEQTGLRRPHRMVATRDFSSRRAQFTVYGPTCDSLDILPDAVELPADLREGDWIEFGAMGAYGLACRTAFNGFFPNTFVSVENEFEADASPVG